MREEVWPQLAHACFTTGDAMENGARSPEAEMTARDPPSLAAQCWSKLYLYRQQCIVEVEATSLYARFDDALTSPSHCVRAHEWRGEIEADGSVYRCMKLGDLWVETRGGGHRRCSGFDHRFVPTTHGPPRWRYQCRGEREPERVFQF